MFKKVIFLVGAVLLISSLSLLMAAEKPQLTSIDQKESMREVILQPQKVSEMRTLTVKQPLQLRTTRDNLSTSGTRVQRDNNDAKVTTPLKEQPRQDKPVFQRPVQERKNNISQPE